jgi:hypothetical protein
MSPTDLSDNQRIGEKERTSPCHTSVLNLGNTPRLIASESTVDNNNKDNEDVTKLPDWDPRKFLPSQAQAMALLKRVIIPERRDNFVRRFEAAMKEGWKEDNIAKCGTPIRWLAKAYWCSGVPIRLQQASDMFPNSGITSEFLNEFYIMDVVLNRALSPPAAVDKEKQNVGERDGP